MMMGVRDSGKKDNTIKELDPQTTLQEDCYVLKNSYIYVWIYENGAKELKSRPKRAFFSGQKLSPKVTI